MCLSGVGHLFSASRQLVHRLVAQLCSSDQETSMTDCLGSGNVATFGYDSDGSLTTTTFPSGTTTSETHTYDNTDALTDTSYKIGSTATDLAALTANADELFGTTTPP